MFQSILERLAGAEPRVGDPDSLQIAVAVLLVHAAKMDDHFDDSERRAIERVLAERFHLSAEATGQLLNAAERRAETSSQIYPFTHLAVERLDEQGRIRLIEMLWEVAYADGVLDPDEDALLRRIAGLIYVSDRDRGTARQRVLRKLGLAKGNESIG
jgi:uncharacterized tellurite resistance protein B-like protein